jgi:glucose/arabinose dehydrogenase
MRADLTAVHRTRGVIITGVSWPSTLAFVAAIGGSVAGCGSAPSPASPAGSGAGNTISGRERIAWDQQADDPAQAARFRYAIYVDGTRSELTAVSCTAGTIPQTFACSGKGPDLSPGSHTLELAAFTTDGESARSSALVVAVSALTITAGPVDWPRTLTGETPDGLTLHVEKVVSGLDDPIDAAFAPDGRLFIVERTGRVRIVDHGQLQPVPAFSARVDDGGSGERVLSLAIDPDFARSHFLFLAQATNTGSGDVFRLARYREVSGTLGERAVLIEVESPPIADAAAVLRVGGDGKLYLAAGGANFGGTLLRLNADGSMPRDQAGTSPAVAQGLQRPDGLGIDARSGLVWIADEQDGEAHLSGVGFDGPPLRAVVRARHALTDGGGSLAFYRGAVLPGFQNTLLLASASGRHLERIRFSDQPDTLAGTDTFLQDAVGPIQAVTVAPDGSIYFFTNDEVGRITGGK